MRSKINITLDHDIANTNLTPRQKQVLQVIREFIKQYRYPPTVREVGNLLGLTSSASIHAHMTALVEAGYLNRDRTKPRALEITHVAVDSTDGQVENTMITIPLVGKVTAGVPILATENIDDFYPLPLNLLQTRNPKDLFMLAVSGDSMKNAGILDGDYIVVQKQSQASNGDIVVALVDEEDATVKRFFKKSNSILLLPENDDYQPIESKNISVIGKVISLFRNL